MQTYVTPVLGALSVEVVDTLTVLSVLRPIWQSKHVTAGRVQQRIEAVIDWAATQGYRAGANPARWKGLLSYARRHSGHSRGQESSRPALPEIADLIAELQARDDRDALCLLLLIYTATRVDAAAGARKEEFDLDKHIWTIPAARMKRRGKRKALGFRVPLSDAAIRIVERAGVKTGILFSRASNKSLGYAHGRKNITTHGFRSTFRDWCAEQTEFPREIVEMSLSHGWREEEPAEGGPEEFD